MKNYFVIHALGNTADDYWYNFIKQTVAGGGTLATYPPCHH